jgi:hypothetical protein
MAVVGAIIHEISLNVCGQLVHAPTVATAKNQPVDMPGIFGRFREVRPLSGVFFQNGGADVRLTGVRGRFLTSLPIF